MEKLDQEKLFNNNKQNFNIYDISAGIQILLFTISLTVQELLATIKQSLQPSTIEKRVKNKYDANLFLILSLKHSYSFQCDTFSKARWYIARNYHHTFQFLPDPFIFEESSSTQQIPITAQFILSSGAKKQLKSIIYCMSFSGRICGGLIVSIDNEPPQHRRNIFTMPTKPVCHISFTTALPSYLQTRIDYFTAIRTYQYSTLQFCTALTRLARNENFCIGACVYTTRYSNLWNSMYETKQTWWSWTVVDLQLHHSCVLTSLILITQVIKEFISSKTVGRVTTWYSQRIK